MITIGITILVVQIASLITQCDVAHKEIVHAVLPHDDADALARRPRL